MIRLFFWLALWLGIAMGAVWVTSSPGNLLLAWHGWEIQTSAALVIFLVFLLLAAGIFLTQMSMRVMSAPRHRRLKRRNRRLERGMDSLTRSLALLTAGNTAAAQREVARTRRFLGSTALTHLLSAQLAKAQNKEAELHTQLQEMLRFKPTEYLAARSLSEHASRQREWSKAVTYAERAITLQPKEKAALLSLISLNARLRQWADAHHSVQRASRGGAILHAQAKRYEAVLWLAESLQLTASSEAPRALALAEAAERNIPYFAPAVLRILELKKEEPVDTRLKLLRKAWKHDPHPSLNEPMIEAVDWEMPQQAMQNLRKLTAPQSGASETHALLARLAMRFGLWGDARSEAVKALGLKETKTSCRLMADILMQGFQAAAEANEWLLRAQSAKADASYCCRACAHAQAGWQPECPECQTFDGLSWQDQDRALLAPCLPASY